jgi:hypothetical protein
VIAAFFRPDSLHNTGQMSVGRHARSLRVAIAQAPFAGNSSRHRAKRRRAAGRARACRPAVNAGRVQVIEHQPHRVVPDRLHFQDGDVLFAGDSLAFRGGVTLNLGARLLTCRYSADKSKLSRGRS